MQRVYLACAITAFAAAATAQDFIGFSYNTSVSATSRGALGNNAGEVMTRIDAREYAGWGTGTPGTRTISSLFFVAQDQVAGAVAGTFDIKLYPEDPANPHMPQTTAPVVFATGVTGPTGTGTPAAIGKIVTPATPVSVPIQGNGDVFVAFALQAVTATQSMSIQIILGYNPSTFTVFDMPGSAQPPAVPSPTVGGAPPSPITTSNTHFVSLTSTPALVQSGRRCHFFDVGHAGPGGAALTITNQTSYTASNNPPPAGFGPAPGTASFMSGPAPDISGFNPGRADDITFDFFKTGIGTGAPVFFLMDLSGAFGPEIPITTIVPGSGVICLNTASAVSLGFLLTNADEAFKTTSIPAGLRPLLTGLIVSQQAAAIDAANNVILTPCGAQKF
jgi:hypothetical protein